MMRETKGWVLTGTASQSPAIAARARSKFWACAWRKISARAAIASRRAAGILDLIASVSAGSVGCYEGLHVLAGLARKQGTTDSVILSNVLRRSMTREAARHSLSSMPVGQHPQVHIAAAEGLSLRVVSSITSH